MISVLFVFYYYNFIGELARGRGFHYNHLFYIQLDNYIPNFPIMIVPYLLVYALVWVYWFSVRIRAPQEGKSGWDLGKLRRGWGVHILLILTGYVIFYLVPVHIAPLGNYEPGSGFFDKLAFQIVHRGMTRYAAFPSMHVANAWFCVWLHREQNLPGLWIARVLSYFQLVDTVLVRAHYLLDLPAGLILAEVFGRFILAPIEKRKWFNSIHPLPSAAIIILPILFYLPIIYLSSVTGWGGLENLLK